MTGPMPAFPAGFRWGVSTASYQVEGAVNEDGRGASIWDTFTHEPGRIADDSTGDEACDHYHRYPEDVALMARLGVRAYRFSLAWPRIQPEGAGTANPAGLDFYDRLVDALLQSGIDPVATLYHWDLPQAVQDAGGWLDRDTAHRFADYAALAAETLGDRVKLWITLNEPVIHFIYGHIWGMHAPGQQLLPLPDPAAGADQSNAYAVAHHQLLGHGLAVAAVRAHTSSPVSIANNYAPAWPVGQDGRRESATDADRHAATRFDALHNRLFTDPLLLGRYPSELAEFAGAGCLDPDAAGTVVREGDLAVISTPVDALGVNYYSPSGVGEPGWPGPFPFDQRLLDGFATTYFGWPVVPDGLRELLVLLRDRYREALPPIYVTENGCAYDDRPGPDGTIADPERIAYLDGHIRAVAAARDAGVDVRGYFVWSLLDNFEWAEGYSKRFGLVHVDFETQKRTEKASYQWYRAVIAGEVGAVE